MLYWYTKVYQANISMCPPNSHQVPYVLTYNIFPITKVVYPSIVKEHMRVLDRLLRW
jgi:hypothetical protein